MHPDHPDALVDDAQQIGQRRVPGRRGQPHVEVLVERHEPGIGLRLLPGEDEPLVAQELEARRHRGWSQLGRPPQGLQLEGHAHLVEVVDLVDVGGDGPVATLGVGTDQALGVQPEERFPHRCPRHPQQGGQPLLAQPQMEGEVAHEQPPLELVVGVLTAQPDRRILCIQARIHRGQNVRTPGCRAVSGPLRSRVAYLAST